MVCCAIIAGLLAVLLRPGLARRPNPLAWRPDETSSAGCPPRSTGRLKSFAHAFDGIGFAIRNEPNMRIHFAVALATVLAAAGIGIGSAEWRWLVLAIAFVLVAESLNTATEQAANAITHRFDPAIKAAKDVAAGAVLLAACAALAIGISVFLPHIVRSGEFVGMPVPGPETDGKTGGGCVILLPSGAARDRPISSR